MLHTFIRLFGTHTTFMAHRTTCFVIALTGLLLVGCSKHSTNDPNPPSPKTSTLGTVDLTNQSPVRYDLGGGKACTITAKLVDDGIHDVSVAIEATDASGNSKVLGTPRARPLPGQPVTVGVGDITVSFTPRFK